jgi:hypothetical protein
MYESLYEKRRETSDRRAEPRVSAAGRIHWKKRSSEPIYRGWLSDQSRSSLSFITGSDTQPSAGEALEILEPDHLRRRCHVTRIAGYDDRLCFVACRADTDEPCPSGHGPDAQPSEEPSVRSQQAS